MGEELSWGPCETANSGRGITHSQQSDAEIFLYSKAPSSFFCGYNSLGLDLDSPFLPDLWKDHHCHHPLSPSYSILRWTFCAWTKRLHPHLEASATTHIQPPGLSRTSWAITSPKYLGQMALRALSIKGRWDLMGLQDQPRSTNWQMIHKLLVTTGYHLHDHVIPSVLAASVTSLIHILLGYLFCPLNLYGAQVQLHEQGTNNPPQSLLNQQPPTGLKQHEAVLNYPRCIKYHGKQGLKLSMC